MGNHAIEAIKRAAQRYHLDSFKLFFKGIDRPGWWGLFGEPAKARANDNLATVEAFNAELEDCRACIAPDVPAGLTEIETLAFAIEHFREVAQRCENYADALEAIARANFEGVPE